MRAVWFLWIYAVIVNYDGTAANRMGVDFQPRGEIDFVANFHALVVEIDLDSFVRELQSTQQQLKAVMSEIRGGQDEFYISQGDLLFHHMESLIERIRTINEVEKIVSGVPVSRYRRGLINGVGVVGSYLFGIATQQQLDDIDRRVATLNDSNTEVVEHLNTQTTIIRAMSKELVSTNKAITTLKDMASILQWDLTTTQKVERLQWLHGITNQIAGRINAIEIGFQTMRTGRVAPELISIKELKRALSEIQRNGKHLLFENVQQMNLYTSLSLVVPLSSSTGKHRFSILLPLRDFSYKFHLFEIITIPIWNVSMEMGFEYSPSNRYLAVSGDMTVFSPIATLDECTTSGLHYMCPATFPMYLREHRLCEILLYIMEDEINTSCERNVFTTKDPIFRRTSGGYIYSAPTPIQLSIKCNHDPAKVSKQTIQGLGTIKLKRGCQAAGRGILLVSPLIDGNMTANVLVEAQHWGNATMTTKLEEEMFANHTQMTRELLESGHRVQNINTMVSKLKFIQEQKHLRAKANVLTYIWLCFELAIVLALMWCNRRHISACCKKRSTQKPNESTDDGNESEALMMTSQPAIGLRRSTRPRIRNDV